MSSKNEPRFFRNTLKIYMHYFKSSVFKPLTQIIVFVPGAQRLGGVKRYDTFMDKVVTMVQQELHERLNGSMYRVLLPDHLVSVSGRSINLGKDRWSRIFGLTFLFWRNGSCKKWIYKGKKGSLTTLRCPVKFNDLKLQLPQLDNEGTVYVVHATITGTLVFQEGNNYMFFQRLIWNKNHYEMRNSDGKPVNPPPAAYCLKAKSPSSLKGILQTTLENLIEHGLFKDAVVFALKKIRKPMPKAKTIIKYS
ncbi:uncharacterized protein LOC115318508 [Ixodes scapularis]|uniref:uncharacterized protein LOC115318508 n=1 Tax=Ixodes scapularis TaxID=6945 RepID=UPI001A9D6D24|nr:uncharacterized protein LOC115318508 [Ixodes scapularis]